MPQTHIRFRAADLRTSIQHLIAEAVTRLEQQHLVAGHLFRRNPLPRFPGMTDRYDDLEQFVVKRTSQHPRQIERQGQDGDVNIVIAQHVSQIGCHVFLDHQRHIGRHLFQGVD